jgi:hypothetical protein
MQLWISDLSRRSFQNDFLILFTALFNARKNFFRAFFYYEIAENQSRRLTAPKHGKAARRGSGFLRALPA